MWRVATAFKCWSWFRWQITNWHLNNDHLQECRRCTNYSYLDRECLADDDDFSFGKVSLTLANISQRISHRCKSRRYLYPDTRLITEGKYPTFRLLSLSVKRSFISTLHLCNFKVMIYLHHQNQHQQHNEYFHFFLYIFNDVTTCGVHSVKNSIFGFLSKEWLFNFLLSTALPSSGC